jgi:hypothetical protein
VASPVEAAPINADIPTDNRNGVADYNVAADVVDKIDDSDGDGGTEKSSSDGATKEPNLPEQNTEASPPPTAGASPTEDTKAVVEAPDSSKGSNSQERDYQLASPIESTAKAKEVATKESDKSNSSAKSPSLFGVAEESPAQSPIQRPNLNLLTLTTYSNDARSRKRYEEAMRKFSGDTLPPSPRNTLPPSPKKARNDIEVNTTVLHEAVQPEDAAASQTQRLNDTVLHSETVFTPEKSDAATPQTAASNKSQTRKQKLKEWKSAGRKNNVAGVISNRGNKYDPDSHLRLPDTMLRSPGVFNTNARETGGGLFSTSSRGNSGGAGNASGGISSSSSSGNSSRAGNITGAAGGRSGNAGNSLFSTSYRGNSGRAGNVSGGSSSSSSSGSRAGNTSGAGSRRTGNASRRNSGGRR